MHVVLLLDLLSLSSIVLILDWHILVFLALVEDSKYTYKYTHVHINADRLTQQL